MLPNFSRVLAICIFAMIASHTQGQIRAETARLIAEDLNLNAFFGASIAIEGETIVVGAYGKDVQGLGALKRKAGAVYIFDAETRELRLQLLASPSRAGDRLGRSVAISGDIVVAGADGTGSLSQGALYVFDTTTGQQRFKLFASDAEHGDMLGSSVGVSGQIAIAGVPFSSDYSGAAYLFDIGTGEELFKLTAPEPERFERFGISVAISGTTAIVGALTREDSGNVFGSAYLFDATTGEQLSLLRASDAHDDQRFGLSVAISGTTAIVGAPSDRTGGIRPGAAYLFDTRTGQQLHKLLPSDAEHGGYFGVSVAISGDTAVVGANRQGVEDSTPGSVYSFDILTGQQLSKLTTSDGEPDDEFGVSVAVAGDTMLVGAPRIDLLELGPWGDAGGVYLYEPCPADLGLPPGTLNFADLVAFLIRFSAQDPSVDFAEPFGTFNFFDLGEYLSLFNQGCP